MQKRGIIEMQMLMFALALVAASTQVRAQGRHPCDLTAQPYPERRAHAQAYQLVGQGACRGFGGALDLVNSRSKAGLDKARALRRSASR